MKNMKVIFHDDLDGILSAAIIKIINPKCKCISYNHHQDFPISMIKKDETVFLVDLTLSQDLMEKINNKAKLILIDHHISINDINIKPFKKYCKIGTAACKLTYQFFYKNKFNQVVEYINNYDIWNHEDPNVLFFHYGILTEKDLSPDNIELWKKLLSDDFDCSVYINYGKIINSYVTNINKEKMKNNAYFTEFHGYKAICINDSIGNAKTFNSCNEDHDLEIIFRRTNNKKWAISIYTKKNNINCTEIAKTLSDKAGGHAKAAGATVDTLPEELLG